MAAIAATASLSAQGLLIDFNSTSQDAGPHPQVGYESYDARHEVNLDFVTKSFAAFGTTIDVTPAWPNTTDNRVQQMIDRGSGNDANWNDGSGDLDLITDFLGIDTRTGNGGNGDWDGDLVGTPTFMTLTLAGLPAGTYGWTSFHHDTENVHTHFQIELSTDGGTTFASLGQAFYMSDSSAGGNPDSEFDGGGGLRLGPDAGTLDSNATFQIEANGTDDVVLRFAPLSGVLGSAVHNQIWGINGLRLFPLDDGDGDGLADAFEQAIIDADLGDAINTIEDVLPGDDFDNDGSTNQQESANNTDPTDDDSDDDTLLDGVETNTGTYSSPGDTGTNPNSADSDGDGIDDGAEVNGVNGFFTDPNKADTDGDGFDDDDEIAANTDPTDANDFPVSSGTSILFIGGQAGPTQGADPAVMAFLEDRYGVQNITYQQAGATNAGDESAFALLVISSTPGSGNMRNKFHNSTTPTLNWEEATVDSGGGEYGMSSVQMTKSQTMTMMDLVEHPITAGLPGTIDYAVSGETTNTTDLFAGLTAVATAANGTGSQGPGNGQDIVGNPTVFIAETGDAVNPGSGITGSVAPARRVMFPMTDSTFNTLTDDGKTLFGQCLDWLLGLTSDNRNKLTDVSHDASTGMLSISWESQPGKIYNLRSETDPGASEPASWPIFSGQMDIPANPPENTLTIPLPAEANRFFVVEEFDPPPVSIYSEDFEMGQGSWEAGPVGAVGSFWELGTPSGVGPTGANSGSNCFGTNIDSNYTDNVSIWLRSPVIDLTTAAGATLNFFQFTDIEFVFDAGTVNVLAADNSFLAEVVTGIDGDGLDGWKMLSKKLPAAALGNMIKLEFLFFSDDLNDFPHAGWYIDDVEVTVP